VYDGSARSFTLRLTSLLDEFIICEYMPRDLLTDFELMLLLATLRVGEDAYGVRIAHEIETTAGRRVLLGAAYAALERLERNGLVSSSIGAATPQRGGRPKRFFRVTTRGLRAVQATQQALTAMWRDIPRLKEKTT
jgi:PadR family transcriptional regulator PadR